jgi:hypothetical protein
MNAASCIWIILHCLSSASTSAFVARSARDRGVGPAGICQAEHVRRLPTTTASRLGTALRRGTWTRGSVPSDSGGHEGRRSAEEEDEDDDEEAPKAYGNRSLKWTERYRRVLPYERARLIAMSLGLRGKEDWDDHLEDGIVFRGPYLPTRPNEMYADDWVSWDEFLGVMRGYDDARRIVRDVLHLRNMDEYRAFVAADVKRAEGLRIPAMPEIVYRDRGWVDENHFFNRS